MPLLDIQRRGRQIGEIRLGLAVRGKDGKTRPSKLSTLRFTCKSKDIAYRVAELLGGTPVQTELQNGVKTFDVVSEVDEIPVLVPPGDNVISQWYEMWTAAGCARRCNGEVEQLTQEACKCPSDPKVRAEQAKSGSACRAVTRLNVMLPDLPDLGVWLLSSTGFNAATELGGAAEVLAAARNQGVIIPAKLRLDQREKRTPGQPIKKFVVPVLEVQATLRQLTELQRGDLADALPQASPATVKAIASGVSQIDDDVVDAELVPDDDLGALIKQLDQTKQAELLRRMNDRKYPSLDVLSSAAEIQVRKWIDELVNDPGRPFK